MGRHEDAIRRAAELLRDAKRVLFITGAGVSADSGLPTYRGVGGLYKDATVTDDLLIEEILSGPMLHQRPELTWKHIYEIENACRGAKPNPAHHMMAKLQEGREVWVLTQNVDGLHREAGSQRIIDIHGDVRTLFCTQCDEAQVVEDYSAIDIPPYCPCGGLIRPDVVLFGELLPTQKVAELERQLAQGFDVIVSVGTSSLFPYIAGPIFEAEQAGIPTIEINPDQTMVSARVDLRIPAGAADTLGQIWSFIPLTKE